MILASSSRRGGQDRVVCPAVLHVTSTTPTSVDRLISDLVSGLFQPMQNQPQKSTAIFIRTPFLQLIWQNGWNDSTSFIAESDTDVDQVSGFCLPNKLVYCSAIATKRIKSKEATPWMHRRQHHPPNRSLITQLMTKV